MSLTDKIVRTSPANVHEDPNNLKVHTDENISHICSSIEKFGFADPIGVVKNPNKKVGGYLVVEGHGRLQAARLLGFEDVPVIVLDLDEAGRKGYAIAHNQIQQVSTMDNNMVALEFSRLDVGPDDYDALGFSQEDVLFLPSLSQGTDGPGTGDKFSAPDGGEYQEQESIGAEAPGAFKAYMPTVHKSTLRFTSDLSYNRFLELLGLIRGRYPTAASLGERLQCLLADLNIVEGEIEGHGANAG